MWASNILNDAKNIFDLDSIQEKENSPPPTPPAPPSFTCTPLPAPAVNNDGGIRGSPSCSVAPPSDGQLKTTIELSSKLRSEIKGLTAMVADFRTLYESKKVELNLMRIKNKEISDLNIRMGRLLDAANARADAATVAEEDSKEELARFPELEKAMASSVGDFKLDLKRDLESLVGNLKLDLKRDLESSVGDLKCAFDDVRQLLEDMAFALRCGHHSFPSHSSPISTEFPDPQPRFIATLSYSQCLPLLIHGAFHELTISDAATCSNIEVSKATWEIANAENVTRTDLSQVLPGQVFLQCLQCSQNATAMQNTLRVFPSSVSLMSSSVFLFQEHLRNCPFVHDHVKRTIDSSLMTKMKARQEEQRDQHALIDFCIDFCRRERIFNKHPLNSGIAFFDMGDPSRGFSAHPESRITPPPFYMADPPSTLPYNGTVSIRRVPQPDPIERVEGYLYPQPQRCSPPFSDPPLSRPTGTPISDEEFQQAKTTMASTTLVFEEEKEFLTEFVFSLLKQMRPCRFKERDRSLQSRKNFRVGDWRKP